MKTKHIFTLIAFLLITNIYSQYNLNDYKYVIVPHKFDFLKEADQYQLNSLTKFLLEKENFQVLFDDANYPEDLAKNRCLGLFVTVLNESGMLTTKLITEIKDCNNMVVFTSKEGASREKNYKKAYHEALRDAFKSFKTINYKYQPTKEKAGIVNPVVVSGVEKSVIKETINQQVVNTNSNSNILYAQATGNGFQLVDSSPKVVMILVSTPKQNVFIVKGQDAIVYEEDGFWYLAKNKSSAKTLNIKF